MFWFVYIIKWSWIHDYSTLVQKLVRSITFLFFFSSLSLSKYRLNYAYSLCFEILNIVSQVNNYFICVVSYFSSEDVSSGMSSPKMRILQRECPLDDKDLPSQQVLTSAASRSAGWPRSCAFTSRWTELPRRCNSA